MAEETENNLSVEYMFSQGEFNSAEEFSVYVERLAVKHKDRYLSILMDYCEAMGIEPEVVSKSLTPSLKEKLEAECSEYNLLKTTKTNKLPE